MNFNIEKDDHEVAFAISFVIFENCELKKVACLIFKVIKLIHCLLLILFIELHQNIFNSVLCHIDVVTLLYLSISNDSHACHISNLLSFLTKLDQLHVFNHHLAHVGLIVHILRYRLVEVASNVNHRLLIFFRKLRSRQWILVRSWWWLALNL